MSSISVKDHAFYVRMKQLTPSEVAARSLGEIAPEHADKAARRIAFRDIAKQIIAGRAERTKRGFNSDTNGEIARAMEWAFQAGVRSAQTR